MSESAETITILQLADNLKKMVAGPGEVPKAICFDYFDTLVFRTVVPEKTKVLAAHQLSLLLGDISGDLLYNIRRRLEAKLCGESRGRGRDPEFSLPELAARLHRLVDGMAEDLGLLAGEQQFVECFCDIELAVEKQVQRPYPELLELLEWLKKQGARLCLVSDFYIPGNYFQAMLAHHGFQDFFTEVFISVDYGIGKGSGRLYGEICRQLGCRPEELLMIGDNLHADKRMAEQAGLRALLIDVAAQQRRYRQWQEQNRSAGERAIALTESFDRIVAAAADTPFHEMGATLWRFVANLFDRLLAGQVTDVFFCSKEGEFLLRLFNQYQEKMFGGRLIAGHYLVVSRKATFICSLQPLGRESFSRLFDQYRDLSLTEFVLSLNFSGAQLAALTAQLDFDWTLRLAGIQEQEQFRALLTLPLFQEIYERHREEQRQNFLNYLQSFGVDFRTKGLHLVDVGWKGSIQNNIYFALDEAVPVQGYYLGLLSPSGLTDKNRKTGLLFSDYPAHSPFIHVYNNNRSLFEMVLGASHGSADGYFRKENLEAARAERGCSVLRQGLGPLAVAVTVLDLPEERQLFEERIVPLQQLYLTMFEQLTAALIEAHGPPPAPAWFAGQHARMLFRPTGGEVDFFARLYHLENFGLFEFTTFGAKGALPLWQRLRNLFELWKNPAGLLETGVWPPIIFRRLGLAWLQPLDGWKRYRRIFLGQP
jgi:HAD superfamily hydrolase (TIGR01549 family)